MIYPLANIVPPKDDDIFVSDNLKMDQMLWGAEAEICSEGGHRKFEALLEAQEKLLYPGCNERHTLLHFTLDFLRLKQLMVGLVQVLMIYVCYKMSFLNQT